MELPGLTKALYGMTKAEAWQAGICIDCKKHATWYSPAGRAEYSISGLCEPCFDKITEEPGREATETLGCTQGAARHPHG
jgi:hypothetical protein